MRGCIKYTHHNQHSDFMLIERFVDKDGQPEPIDAFNWKVRYYTDNWTSITAEHRDGMFINCTRNDDSSVVVIFDNPAFRPGLLRKITRVYYPNPLFDDGIESIEIPGDTGIKIVEGPSSDSGRVESQTVLDYMQGNPGENGHSPYYNKETETWWEFNDETQQYEDTGIGGGGGVTQEEFEEAIARIYLTDTSQDEAIENNAHNISAEESRATSAENALRTDVDRNSQAIIEVAVRVDTLYGAVIYIGTIPLASTNVTQDALNSRAEELGFIPVENGYTLVDEGGHEWRYESRFSQWVDMGVFSVSQATNKTDEDSGNLGIVKGSLASLDVAVREDGTMYVSGLSDWYASVNTHLSDIDGEITILQSTVGDINSLLDLINRKVV